MKFIKKFYHLILDFCCTWLMPFFSFLSLISGVFLTYDIEKIRQQYPNWHRFFDIVESYLPALFIGSAVIVLFISLAELLRRKTIYKLEASIRKIECDLQSEREKVDLIASNIETLFNGFLLKLSEKIGFDKGESSRLTIYIHNNNGHFISFGRYSPDPLHNSKGRNLLPDNSGCLSKAWSSDWCYEGNLTYKDSRRKKYNLDKNTYESQRMKAVFFAVKRIDSSNKQPLAVLVFESKTANRFPEQQIKSILDEEEAYFAEIVGCLKDHIPNPQDATNRGF